jgi:isopentenyl diphosphate isomerase/L-lactate dehydrogenase-like FMN-dependent dehydrogenase
MARQFAIYSGGAPLLPVDPVSLELAAREVLSPEAFDYVAGGASSEQTMRANREAFDRWRLVPRMLRNVEQRDLSVELFGRRLSTPIVLAPIGVQGIVRTESELEVARAAASVGVPYVLSTASSSPLEAVAASAPEAVRWFQLYWPRDPALAESLVRRAESAGFGAMVVTLDTFHLGWRPRDLERAYLPFLRGEGLANYFSDPVFRSGLADSPELAPEEAIRKWAAVFSDPSLTWSAIRRLRSWTRLPIVLKGILHPEDAAEAVRHGVDGIIVSNHGGRQVDGAIGALDALPEVVKSVGGAIPVLFDSGIRTGSDALKAICLGAAAILLGRPYIWAVAIAGEQGVRDYLMNFIAEFDLALGLTGHASLAEASKESLKVVEPL